MKFSIQWLVCLLAIFVGTNEVKGLTSSEIMKWRKLFKLENIEMPSYEVLKTLENDVEVRKYKASKWACSRMEKTVVGQMQNRRDSTEMFGHLFKYISGENSAKQKIAMTAPVLMDYSNKDNAKVSMGSSSEVDMCFYVPDKLHQNTPKPTDSRVMLQDLPEVTVAVSMYTGFPSLQEHMKQRDIVIKALGSSAQNYDTARLITAGYDAPYQLLFRRNEVMVMKM